MGEIFTSVLSIDVVYLFGFGFCFVLFVLGGGVFLVLTIKMALESEP